MKIDEFYSHSINYGVLQCLIADLKLSCMYRVSTNWDRVCIDIHDTRYTKHDTRRVCVSCSELWSIT